MPLSNQPPANESLIETQGPVRRGVPRLADTGTRPFLSRPAMPRAPCLPFASSARSSTACILAEAPNWLGPGRLLLLR